MTTRKDAKSTITVTKPDPNYAWAECGGGGKETDGAYCSNTVKFAPEIMHWTKCPACGVIWELADDDATATSTFDEAAYANASMIEFARTGRVSKIRAI